ncbi:hypothetical protein [Ruegeria sp. 6PALISEP08]|uniref:hypothetical protein n=1 Tax=Ruegeria sp. 6PALISEP08 TaxID=1225660 RepID=UPI0012EDA21E|nr:hypothetical protein [Ruegeria sp. 6PALISEP08]
MRFTLSMTALCIAALWVQPATAEESSEAQMQEFVDEMLTCSAVLKILSIAQMDVHLAQDPIAGTVREKLDRAEKSGRYFPKDKYLNKGRKAQQEAAVVRAETEDITSSVARAFTAREIERRAQRLGIEGVREADFHNDPILATAQYEELRHQHAETIAECNIMINAL